MRGRSTVQLPSNTGFSFLELLLAVAVGSIIMAAIYASYLIAARQYTRLVAVAEVQDSGIPVLNLLARDIRMAGYTATDTNMQTPYGPIASPVTITDSGNTCCDSLTLIYDKDTTTRQRVSYFVLPQNNPTRNVLYMSKATWNGTAWVGSVTQAPVADYIEDLQFVGSNPDLNGTPRLVDFSMIFRSKTPLVQSATYQKPTYNVGNYAFTSNDAFFRDDFFSTVKIRNLR